MGIYDEKPWLLNYAEKVPGSIDYENVTLVDFLNRSVRDFPENTALNFQGYRLSYRELDEMVNAMARHFIDLDIGKGDRIAILLPNVIPCVVAYYAAMKIGAVVVMNNPLYTDRELLHQFNDSGARLLVTLDLLAERMIRLRSRTSIENIIYTSIGDYLPRPVRWVFPIVGPKKGLCVKVSPMANLISWKNLLEKNFNPAPPRDPGLTPASVAMYQYTGGTTGVSKGVILTHGNLSRQVQQVAAWFPGLPRGRETMLGALPFFHVFGLTISMNWAVMMGWGNVLVPKPQPDPLMKTLSKFRPSILPMVPTMFVGIINHPKIDRTDLSAATACFSGSAPIPQEVIREFEAKTGAVICEGFGMTESSPVTHINPFHPDKRKVGSIGIPIPDTECRIVDLETGTMEMPVGQPGELVVRGPQVMQGYWNNPGDTAQTLKDGWLHTGDIATMDEDGYFYIVDRKKDLIIAGGFNVYPRDVEEVLYSHSDIVEASVVGVPHPKRGETVKAYVVLKPGATTNETDIIAWCKKHLAAYKLPTEVEFRGELPKTSVGKILKKVLREESSAAGGEMEIEERKAS